MALVTRIPKRPEPGGLEVDVVREDSRAPLTKAESRQMESRTTALRPSLLGGDRRLTLGTPKPKVAAFPRRQARGATGLPPPVRPQINVHPIVAD